MKKILKLMVMCLATVILVACSNNSNDIEDYGTSTNYTQATPAELDLLDKASYLIERLNLILDADDGYLWGVDLHGPFVIVDAITRDAVANMPDEEGEIFTRQGDLYVGRLPEGTIIGNTASEFSGQLWGMATWGFIEGLESTEGEIDNLVLITNLMIHELFHANQPYIFGDLPDGDLSDHMTNLDARISVKLEINALLYGLRTTGDEQRLAVYDALSIRAERHRLYPDAIGFETIFEISEGTAVYTEAVLGMDSLADRIALVEMYMGILENDIPREFGYFTGALYALLLDELSIDWREDLSWESDLAELLKEGIGFTEIIPFDEIDIEKYGYLEIRPLEEAWVAENERLIQEARDILSGPLLLIDIEGEFDYWGESFDVHILELDRLEIYSSGEFDYGQEGIDLIETFGQPWDQTVFYGDFTYTTHFGELEVTRGFLQFWSVMWRHGISASDMEVDGNRIITPSWILTLNEGYELREVDGGHFRIARQD